MATTQFTSLFESGSVSLRRLALLCASDDRSMLCGSVRKLPPGAPLPREITIDPWFEQRLSEAQATVDRIAALSAEENEAHAQDEFAQRMAMFRAELNRVTRMNAQPRATEAKILSWDAPSEFEPLRKDMLREIRATLVDVTFVESLRPAAPQPGPVWHAEQMRIAVYALAMARKDMLDEQLRVERVNQSLSRLLASLSSL